jgi:hypothetical protein
MAVESLEFLRELVGQCEKFHRSDTERSGNGPNGICGRRVRDLFCLDLGKYLRLLSLADEAAEAQNSFSTVATAIAYLSGL